MKTKPSLSLLDITKALILGDLLLMGLVSYGCHLLVAYEECEQYSEIY